MSAPPGTETEPDPRRWRALRVTLVAGFMSLLDVSIVAVALPSLREDLGASAAQIQWVVSGYALTFGMALVPAGRLGDALGRRRMFLGALAAFTLSSAAVALAPGVGWLIAARLVQGVAAGCLAPQNSGLIQQLFRGAERGRAFGAFGATVGVSTAIGPVLGGLILTVADGPDGWRWLFWVNVPVGVLALVLAARLLPRDDVDGVPHLDVVGALLLGAGVFGVLLPLVTAEADGLRRLWWTWPVSVAVLAAFVAWESRVRRLGRSPLLDPHLMRSTPGYAAGILLGTVYFVGFSGLWLVFAIFLQDGLGFSPLRSGATLTPYALGAALAALVAGRLVERRGRVITVAGLMTVIAALLAVAAVVEFAPTGIAVWAILPILLAGGLGGGMIISPNITMTVRNVPVHAAGVAGGALQTGQRMGAAVGSALLPALYYLVLARDGRPAEAFAVSLVGAVVALCAALGVAVADVRRARSRMRSSGETGNHARVGATVAEAP